MYIAAKAANSKPAITWLIDQAYQLPLQKWIHIVETFKFNLNQMTDCFPLGHTNKQLLLKVYRYEPIVATYSSYAQIRCTDIGSLHPGGRIINQT